MSQAYGHGGTGIVVTALTDNVNRAIAEVKTVWRKQGLKQAAQGSVLFQFEKRGRVEVEGEADEEQVQVLFPFNARIRSPQNQCSPCPRTRVLTAST